MIISCTYKYKGWPCNNANRLLSMHHFFLPTSFPLVMCIFCLSLFWSIWPHFLIHDCQPSQQILSKNGHQNQPDDHISLVGMHEVANGEDYQNQHQLNYHWQILLHQQWVSFTEASQWSFVVFWIQEKEWVAIFVQLFTNFSKFFSVSLMSFSVE